MSFGRTSFRLFRHCKKKKKYHGGTKSSSAYADATDDDPARRSHLPGVKEGSNKAQFSAVERSINALNDVKKNQLPASGRKDAAQIPSLESEGR